MKEKLIQLFEEQNKWTLKELEDALELKETAEFIDLMKTLNLMEEERLIYRKHDKYVWIDCDKYFIGRLKDISRFEYAVSNGQDKIYVQKRNVKDAFDRDEVLVKKGKKKGNRVVHVYNHGIENIIGEFFRTRDGWKFRSDIDLHVGFKVVNLNEFSISNKDKAVVKIVRYSNPLEVKIIRLLGPANEKGVDVTAMLYQNNVRMGFSPKVLEELKNIPDSVSASDLEGRTDFRNLQTITIDGDHSKDFDDAISLEKTDFGWRLYVHIADVAHYVKEGSAIDQEAYARGTSVYVVDRVVPMLPFELSNGICSLNPDVDRLTMTAIIDINQEGEIIDSKVVNSVIHSNKRCTYKKVNEYLDGTNPAVQQEYAEIGDLLKEFAALAKVLQNQTKKRGSIEFETKEPVIELDENGKPVDIYVPERGFAEQMIEEAMIRANVAIAHTLNSQDKPGIYRVHATPDPEKLTSLANSARAMNVPVTFNPNDATASDIQDFLEGIEDEKSREILGLMALRAMQKAVYSQECIGHYGLALPEYAHFTSPIRRYPDLIMHRMLKKHSIGSCDEDIEKDKGKIREQAVHTSQKERDAIAVERAVDNYEMARYMEDKVGQKFKGSIGGVTNFGFFVELPNGIEGLVPLRTLQDDYYNFDENTLSLTGENTGKTFRIGDDLDVYVTEVDVPKGLITFGLNNVPAVFKEQRKVKTA